MKLTAYYRLMKSFRVHLNLRSKVTNYVKHAYIIFVWANGTIDGASLPVHGTGNALHTARNECMINFYWFRSEWPHIRSLAFKTLF